MISSITERISSWKLRFELVAINWNICTTWYQSLELKIFQVQPTVSSSQQAYKTAVIRAIDKSNQVCQKMRTQVWIQITVGLGWLWLFSRGSMTIHNNKTDHWEILDFGFEISEIQIWPDNIKPNDLGPYFWTQTRPCQSKRHVLLLFSLPLFA